MNRIACFILLVFNATSVSAAFQTYSIVGAPNTYINGINNNGLFAGTYTTIGSEQFGFIWNGTDSYTTISVQGSTDTSIHDINDNGDVVGFFYNGNNYNGFLRSASGDYTILQVSGATATLAVGLNNLGEIVGSYSTDGGHTQHGFVRDVTGIYTTFDIGAYSQTSAYKINNLSQIVGDVYPFDNNLNYQGFIGTTSSSVTTFEVGGGDTTAYGVNDLGDIVGRSGASNVNGFFRDAAGASILFKLAGSQTTYFTDINNSRQIVGNYQDSQGFVHGLMGSLEDNGSSNTIPEASTLFLLLPFTLGLFFRLKNE